VRGELAAQQPLHTLERALKRQFVEDGVRGVVLDVGEVRTLDEDGIAALMRLRSDALDHGKRLFVEGAQGKVRSKLSVAGILDKLARGV
jgi:anti-anti-sigma regulatory factor